MKRPDWKIAGAAGLLAGLTVGGFSFVSASGTDRAVRTIELEEGTGAASPALRWIDESSDSAQVVEPRSSAAVPTATPAGTDSVDSAESTSSPDVVARPIVEERTATPKPKATQKPAPAPVATPADSDSASADSASADSDSASADSADSSD
jgi:hypothetical protein